MKTLRNSMICLGILLFLAPRFFAQDVLKYRSFALGTSLTSVLKHTDQKASDVRLIHSQPVLIQELTWWPANGRRSNAQADSVEQIVFLFYAGELYKITVNYDRDAVKGLTTHDMVQSLSAKYGNPIQLTPEIELQSKDQSAMDQKLLATWEDSLSTINLMQSGYSEGFTLVAFSRARNAQAETASAEAVTLEAQQRPQKEADQQKKQGDELELERQKNIKSFQP